MREHHEKSGNRYRNNDDQCSRARGRLLYHEQNLQKQQLNISQYKDDINVLSQKIEVAEEKLQQDKQYLEEEKQNTNSLEYIEKLAREKLGMYLPNERVYIDSNM